MTQFEQDFVVKPEENFRGLPISDWIGLWSNWLFSANPHHDPTTDVLFLRTFVGYDSSQNSVTSIFERDFLGQKKERKFDRVSQVRPINNRFQRKDESPLGEVIDDNTAVFMPLLVSMSWVGEEYAGKVLETEEELRNVGRRITYESRGVWAGYREVTQAGPGAWQNIVDDLMCYRFESSLFKLTVSDKNPFLNALGAGPGIYDAVTVGFFILIKPLKKDSVYDFHFGGNGKADYQTDALYEISVEFAQRSLTLDLSPGKQTPFTLLTNRVPQLPSVDSLTT